MKCAIFTPRFNYSISRHTVKQLRIFVHFATITKLCPDKFNNIKFIRGSTIMAGQKKILVFGTFDGLHEGHLDLFKQARQYGEYLVALVARDSTVLKNKNKTPKFTEEERLQKVKECELIDEALLGTENHDTHSDRYEIIKEINPDIICLGYDQAQFIQKLEGELKSMGLVNTTVRILKPYQPEKYKSSLLNKE